MIALYFRILFFISISLAYEDSQQHVHKFTSYKMLQRNGTQDSHFHSTLKQHAVSYTIPTILQYQYLLLGIAWALASAMEENTKERTQMLACYRTETQKNPKNKRLVITP